MTVTRIWQSGFELGNNSLDAGPSVTFTGSMTYQTPGRSTDDAYALLMGTGRFDFYYDLGSGNGISQGRFNCQFYYGGGIGGLGAPELFYCRTATTEKIRVKYDIGVGWEIWDGSGTHVLTSAATPMSVGWHHIVCHINLAVAGWVYLWIDDTPIISFSGDTTLGGSDAEEWGIGPITGTRRWGSTEAIDDVTIDDLTSEVAPLIDVDRRYYLMIPDGAGFYTDFTPSAGANYQNVDDIPPDSDTTYNEDNIDGDKDSYAVADWAVTSGRKVDAIIPVGVVRKTGPGDTVQVKTFARDNAIDDASAALGLTTTYEAYWHRMTTAPDGGLIYQTTVNALESGVEVSVP